MPIPARVQRMIWMLILALPNRQYFPWSAWAMLGGAAGKPNLFGGFSHLGIPELGHRIQLQLTD